MYADFLRHCDNESSLRTWLEVLYGNEDNKPHNSRDIFCDLYEVAVDRDEKYSARRAAYETMIVMYNNLAEISKEFELISTVGPYKERFARRDRKTLTPFADGINYDAPAEAGLYFLGETHFNPFTHEEFYWVKIGLSTNLKRRMKEYDTHCPMLWRIGYILADNDCLEREEEWYHDKIKEVGIATCNHNEEWFLVDRNTYLEMCAKGFNYFN